MSIDDFKKLKLPDNPGVYFFLDQKGNILYIGKATSLRDRVKSYFSKDLITTRGLLLVQMVEQAVTINVEKTDSVLEALILEVALIKKHQPKFNTKEKDNKSFNFVIITKEEFPRVLVVRGRNIEREYKRASANTYPLEGKGNEIAEIFGPFPNGSALKVAMGIVRKIFPYRDKCEPGQVKPCFNRQIGLCPGVCTGEISVKEYGKIIRHISLFFQGKKRVLLGALTKEMTAYAKAKDFEGAGKIRNTLFALNNIQDVALIKDDIRRITDGGEMKVFRIESYDIAHMAGENMVGVMTVVEDGEPNKSQYRKFIIEGITASNDTGALRQVLERRFAHHDWPMPSLIVMDGALAQRNVALEVLQKLQQKIPVVSVVKDAHHKPKDIEGDVVEAKRHRREILLANNESHRFAITFHKKKRSAQFLKPSR
jgi:excinuclease UvrABC nuclease subunit